MSLLKRLGSEATTFSRKALMSDDIKKELADLEQAEKELRHMKQELEMRETEIKRKLLAGATIEPGMFYAELRLLPGRDLNSKNPDDYDLIVSVVP